jgi:hypothetical protein
MKQVYKCDFCSTIGTKAQIREHEVKCIFNPENKHCYSCKNFKNFRDYDYCELDLNFIEILDGDGKCKEHLL